MSFSWIPFFTLRTIALRLQLLDSEARFGLSP